MRLHEIKEKRAALVIQMRDILANAGDSFPAPNSKTVRFAQGRSDRPEARKPRAQFLENEENAQWASLPEIDKISTPNAAPFLDPGHCRATAEQHRRRRPLCESLYETRTTQRSQRRRHRGSRGNVSEQQV